MSANDVASDDGVVDAILEGGPCDLVDSVRSRRVGVTDHKIKILHRGGYEHFERDHVGGSTPVVFRWTARTAIAE